MKIFPRLDYLNTSFRCKLDLVVWHHTMTMITPTFLHLRAHCSWTLIIASLNHQLTRSCVCMLILEHARSSRHNIADIWKSHFDHWFTGKWYFFFLDRKDGKWKGEKGTLSSWALYISPFVFWMFKAKTSKIKKKKQQKAAPHGVPCSYFAQKWQALYLYDLGLNPSA